MNRCAVLLTASALVASASVAGCSKSMRDAPSPPPGTTPSGLTVTSTAIMEGGAIPTPYTCDGENVPPPLAWTGAPEQTQSFAVIVEDPDASQSKPFVHWVVYEIANDQRELPTFAARQGTNDFGKTGYGGPCPPKGEHRYQFRVYALDTHLRDLENPKGDDVMKAMSGHVLAQGVLTAKYHRPGST